MLSGRDRFPFKLTWLTTALALLVALWHYLPLTVSGAEHVTPRSVTARGDLAADEKSTIEIFEKSKNSVVFISTREQVMDIWTRNVFSVPSGSGSGFIWDDAGRVITNFHVVQGATEARVKLADGRNFKAALVGASPAHDIAVLKMGIPAKRPPLLISVALQPGV